MSLEHPSGFASGTPTTPRRPGRIVAAMCCVVPAGVYVAAQPRRPAVGEWASYGGTNWSQKYSPLDQINRDNFERLRVAWTWQSPDHELIKTLPAYPEMPLYAYGLKGTPLL